MRYTSRMTKQKKPKRRNEADRKAKDLAGFRERLNEALDDANVPSLNRGRYSWFQRTFGVTTQGARRWCIGEAWPESKRWHSIAEALHVRMEWLFFNLGEKHEARAEMNAEMILIIQNVLNRKFPQSTKDEVSGAAFELYERLSAAFPKR
jgi:hypothetical protein